MVFEIRCVGGSFQENECSFKKRVLDGPGSPPRSRATSNGHPRNCRARGERAPGPGTAPRVFPRGRAGSARRRRPAFLVLRSTPAPHHTSPPTPVRRRPPKPALSLLPAANCRASLSRNPMPHLSASMRRRPPRSAAPSPARDPFAPRADHEPHLRALGPNDRPVRHILQK